ncbi:MAG: 6-phosphofructokinase [Clostridia bacterium]|nr:6-phosphofructokinase [Clostridia bacterium]
MNVVVGQSGGPTAVINASLAGVYEAAVRLGADKIYGMKNGIEGFLQENLVSLKEVLDTQMKVELLKRTPSSYLGSCRYKLKTPEARPAEYKKVFEILKKYEIDYFFYIGGNDSMDTILQLSKYGKTLGCKTRFVGVPKTIDNDLMVTDHTPGFGSAAKFVATTLKEVICDSSVYDMKSVTIVEIMGRNAGWLTASAALAKDEDCNGADMIFLPELTFDLDGFIDKVAEMQKTKGNLIIVVSEGIKVADGRYVCELADAAQETDSFGHKRLTGTARFLADECTKRLGVKARAIELSTLQRCASHIASATDIQEAYQAGAAAVTAAAEGNTGVAITLVRANNNPYQCVTGIGNIEQIANHEKTVPLSWIDESGMGMRQEFIDYARPLIEGELLPYYENGLPKHLK